MDSTHTASFDINELSKTASISHSPPGMANNYLLLVEKICNEGYYVTFRTGAVTIYSAAGKSILKGSRVLNTGLRRINLQHEKPQHTVYVANNVYELRSTEALVNYLHRTMFSPTKSDLLQAVKNGHLIA
jgi:hypothetical protein